MTTRLRSIRNRLSPHALSVGMGCTGLHGCAVDTQAVGSESRFSQKLDSNLAAHLGATTIVTRPPASTSISLIQPAPTHGESPTIAVDTPPENTGEHPDITRPNGVYVEPTVQTARTALELEAALSHAGSGRSVNTVVIPNDVVIDLTTWSRKPDGTCRTMEIPAGVTLRSGRRGTEPGGLIMTRCQKQHAMLAATGDGVRIQSLRLEGPSSGSDRDLPPVVGVDFSGTKGGSVSDSELSKWPGAAIKCDQDKALSEKEAINCERNWRTLCAGTSWNFFREPDIRVIGNYIHHNQRDGLGYGVVVGKGAFAEIDGNTFDSNRHDIAADYMVPTGYRAYNNLVLSGGKDQQHFDVHGCGEASEKHFIGGVAGDFVDIAFNTFRDAKRRLAFYLRGTPCNYSGFHHNVLLHSRDEAIKNLSVDSNVRLDGNAFGKDASTQMLVGDFDNDRRDDLFLATGAAWYYSSAGEAPWRFLRSTPEVASELRVADFDADGRADLFTIVDGQWRVSRNGTESWQDLPMRDSTPLEKLRFGDFDKDRRTDVFRATGGAWQVSWGGVSAWTDLNTSRFLESELVFADFDGDGSTDILRPDNLTVSWSGMTTWSLPLDSGRLDKKARGTRVYADFDGDGRADILRSDGAQWSISSGARTNWSVWQTNDADLSGFWIGSFDTTKGADVLRYETSKTTMLQRSSAGRAKFTQLEIGMR